MHQIPPVSSVRIVIFSFIVFVFSGCANPYAKYYQDRTGGIDVTQSSRFILPTGEPEVYGGDDVAADSKKLLEDGYAQLGQSSFNGANVSTEKARNHGKEVHAEKVLVYSRHAGTRSGVIPITTPDTRTSTTNFSGSAFGSYGSTNFSGSASTTNYGTQTTYMPFSVDRYSYFATYWIKRKPPIFGVYAKELPDDVRKASGSNKGVLVMAVVKNSPAFRADIFPDDILKRVGDFDVYDPKTLTDAVLKCEGKKVVVVIWRDGKEVQKEIQFDTAK